MKITKFLHSCLLVETTDRTGVIDPGRFSWESGLFDVASLERLDDIVITHEHVDHMYLPFIQALVPRFPHVRISTTPSAVRQLKAAGLMNVGSQSGKGVELFAANHESNEPMSRPPEHTGVHYLGRLTHPGDSYHIAQSKDIFALPVTSGWGTQGQAAALAAKLRPRYIIPIHDSHWHERARAQYYDRFEKFFETQGITFIKPTDGVAIEL